MEETGLAARPDRLLPPFDWDYPHARLRFFPVLCRVDEHESGSHGGPSSPAAPAPGSAASPAPAGRELRWVELADLGDYEFPPANAALIAQLQAR